LWSGLGRDA